MTDPTPLPTSTGSSPSVAESFSSEADLIWQLLERDSVLPDLVPFWPGENAVSLRDKIIPPHDPSAGPMPIGFAYFIVKDLRTMPLEHRTSLVSKLISKGSLKDYHETWESILHSFLIVHSNSQRTRTRRKTRLQCIHDTVDGYDLYRESEDTATPGDEDIVDPIPNGNFKAKFEEARLLYHGQEHGSKPTPIATDTNENSNERNSSSVTDLQKSIQAMTSLFPSESRITGEESETFNVKLAPIVQQMEALRIAPEHRPTVLFSLLQGKARQTASMIPVHNTTLDSFVEEVSKTILLDPDIQERRVTRWNNLKYSDFRSKAFTEEEATRECIKHTKNHQLDLPLHMRSEQLLLSRLREIFRFIPWCETLYHRSTLMETPASFGSKLISAASNSDLRSKNTSSSSKAITPYPVYQPASSTPQQPDHGNSLSNASTLAAFFAKTPPPPRHRRPQRYQSYRYHRFGSNYDNRRPTHPPQYRQPYSYGSRQSYNSGRPSFQNRAPPFLRRGKKLCYGCGKEGHFLRDCPEKAYHNQRLTHLANIGHAATFLMEHDAEECSDDHSQVLQFVEENANSTGIEPYIDDAEDTSDFHAWICDLLETYDSVTSTAGNSYHVKLSLPELETAMRELVFHATTQRRNMILIDTGAPKTICSIEWLQKANWNPVKIVQLPDHIHPFRFAGHPVRALHGACIIAVVRDIAGNPHYLRTFAFVLPETPIPFLTALQDHIRLGFDLCLRANNGSHLKVNSWNSILPLVVTSHLWLQFETCNSDPDPKFDWTALIQKAIDPATTSGPLYVNTTSNGPTQLGSAQDGIVLDCNGDHDSASVETSQDLHDHASLTSIEKNSYFPVPPWEQDGWTSNTTPDQITRLHKGLKHPDNSQILKLFRQQHGGTKLPSALVHKIMDHKCKDCEEHPQLPRRPKLSIPSEAAPNIVVSLDTMLHIIRNKSVEILVMIDSGDAMISLRFLSDNSALTAFNAYYSAWIAYFDAPHFTVVDRGSNLVNALMADNLRQVQSQLCPIPTEAPWCIGNNERSHKFLHRAIDKLTNNPEYQVGSMYERLLADVEMAWNFCQHSNNILPHYQRFGSMPRILGELETPHTITERVALMDMARKATENARASDLIRRALNTHKRPGQALRLFSIRQPVWFHRRKHGWRTGEVARIDRPTIYVHHYGKLFPTHENRVRPYFGALSLPPPILHDDPDIQEYLDIPTEENMPHPGPVTSSGGAPISELLNGVFACSSQPQGQDLFTASIADTSITVQLTGTELGVADSDNVFLTTTKMVTKATALTKEQQDKFRTAKLEEINFLLKRAVKPVPHADVPTECELQPLKWILAIKTTTQPKASERYRVRLVSASHRSKYRHSVHGNAPTVALSTVRALYAVTPMWIIAAEQAQDPIHLFTRDVTKAYLQSNETQRLIFYRPPKEFVKSFPDYNDHAWKAIVQLYGDVEGGLYWNRTFVPWIVENIPDLHQSMYDPSLLYSRRHNMAILLCTDDTSVVMPESMIRHEEKITERFECRSRQQLPTDFKGVDIARQGDKSILSQVEYLQSHQHNSPDSTKPELQREMTDEEISEHRTVAGQLAWIATGTAPLSAYTSSIALQGTARPVQLKLETIKALQAAKEERASQLTYVPLNPETVHIRMYSDGSFQNLALKHSQIGFIVALADHEDRFNLVHWHSSRSPRRAHSTEESELMAFDIAFRFLRNFRNILFELLKKEVPIVVYIDNQTLWSNLMNSTVPSIPEVMYRCRDYIHAGLIASVCLIPGPDNPADAMTKSRPNNKLKQAVNTNICHTPAKRIFMLQTSPFRHSKYIPTSSVPMPADTRGQESPPSPGEIASVILQ